MNEGDGWLTELCQRAVQRDQPLYSHFLNLAEQRDAAIAARKAGAEASFFGGRADCERKMLGVGAFAPPEEAFPIACLLIAPRGARFAQPLAHRDVLGSLMGLGIEREVLGDIAVRQEGAYIFCESRMADFIMGALEKVGGAFVDCRMSAPPEGALRAVRQTRIPVNAPRADAVIARLYGLSRGDAQTLFRQGRVFMDDAPCERPDDTLKEGQILSVRGYGRARYAGIDGQSKKGKLYLLMEIYA